MCKRGYPFKETNINILKNVDAYEMIIEKVNGIHIRKKTFRYPNMEMAKSKMEEYVSGNLLLEDQVNILQFLANEISHLK